MVDVIRLKGPLGGTWFRACGLVVTLTLSACGGSGSSASSATAAPSTASTSSSTATSTTTSTTSVPATPAGLKATAGNAQVALSWSASSAATSYILKRGTTSGGPYTQIGTATAVSYTDTGLTNGKVYYYVVVAVDSAGDSGSSAQASATPESTLSAVPPVPTGLAVSAGSAEVGLTWTLSAGASSYQVKRATVSGGPYTLIGSPISASYIDTGLTNGTTYYYVIAAVDTAGASGNSSQVSATPAGTATSSPAAVCLTPFGEDTSTTTATVGTGTAASCTETALAGALAKGGVIRFNCGGPATISLTSQLTLSTKINTTLDGQGNITLDGGGKTRLLYYYSANFQATKTVVTIQNITLQNGASSSSGTPIPVAPAPCSQGTEGNGGGAAIFIRDGILHVWNTTFKNNVGAALGPDVGGGAIYTEGSLGTTIVGSTFQSNHASNGGAIGSLFGDLSIYNSQFSSNQATGNGANSINSKCTVNGGESGNGGNGGAVYMDGAEVYSVAVCGSTFTSNSAGAGALGGAIFRTPDAAIQTTTIDRSSFIGNSAPSGGALYFHNSNLVMTASTLSGNTSTGSGGGLFTDGSVLTFTNDTFADNVSEKGLGGSIVQFGTGGTLLNVTFLGNQATGGSGYFGAAIAGGTVLSISNTLFSGNTTDDCYSPMACSVGAASTGHNDLQWPATHAICATADKACVVGTVFSNPELGALQNNGGPTQTAAPLPGSPAVGIGVDCPATDQRGVTRPTTGCTAGAVEGAISP
jgi:fibronectin type 3 domain-containing protein